MRDWERVPALLGATGTDRWQGRSILISIQIRQVKEWVSQKELPGCCHNLCAWRQKHHASSWEKVPRISVTSAPETDGRGAAHQDAAAGRRRGAVCLVPPAVPKHLSAGGESVNRDLLVGGGSLKPRPQSPAGALNQVAYAPNPAPVGPGRLLGALAPLLAAGLTRSVRICYSGWSVGKVRARSTHPCGAPTAP